MEYCEIPDKIFKLCQQHCMQFINVKPRYIYWKYESSLFELHKQ